MPDAGNTVLRERAVQVTEVFAEIIEVLALSPMIRVSIEETEEHSVLVLPVGDLRFHGGGMLRDGGGFREIEKLAGVGDGACDRCGGDHDGGHQDGAAGGGALAAFEVAVRG